MMARQRSMALTCLALGLVGFIVVQIWATRAFVDAARNASETLKHELAGSDQNRLTRQRKRRTSVCDGRSNSTGLLRN